MKTMFAAGRLPEPGDGPPTPEYLFPAVGLRGAFNDAMATYQATPYARVEGAIEAVSQFCVMLRLDDGRIAYVRRSAVFDATPEGCEHGFSFAGECDACEMEIETVAAAARLERDK